MALRFFTHRNPRIPSCTDSRVKHYRWAFQRPQQNLNKKKNAHLHVEVVHDRLDLHLACDQVIEHASTVGHHGASRLGERRENTNKKHHQQQQYTNNKTTTKKSWSRYCRDTKPKTTTNGGQTNQRRFTSGQHVLFLPANGREHASVQDKTTSISLFPSPPLSGSPYIR